MKNLHRTVVDFRAGLLGKQSPAAMCLAVAAPLHGFLNACGYLCKLQEGSIGESNHFWITLPDGQIIDPTADQFLKPDGVPMPPVYIGEKPEWYTEL